MKTTKKQFRLFRKKFVYFCDLLGIKSYSVRITHEEAGECYASMVHNRWTRTAWVTFNRSPGEKLLDEEISKTAFHEACHLLLADMLGTAKARFASEDALAADEEAIVVSLENAFFKQADTVP